MYDLAFRQTLAYGLLGAIALAIPVGFAIYHRESKWRKLRLQGDRGAKQRELQRRRRKARR